MTDPHRAAPHTVVVADDDSDIRELVTIAVTRAGLHLVASVADGAAALAAIREHVPDLVIIDGTMPVMTGMEVCRLVRQNPAFDDVRIVVLSASVDDVSRSSALAAGADHFIAKPFNIRDLTAWLAVGKDPR
jgi:CheY-like chemotaxis protein